MCLVRIAEKLVREGRLAVKNPRWEDAKLNKGLDAISFLFKSYRVSVHVYVCGNIKIRVCIALMPLVFYAEQLHDIWMPLSSCSSPIE